MKKIDEQTWSKAREYYEQNKVSCRDVAEKFNLNQNSVSTRCRREKWRESAKFLEQRLHAKIEAKMEGKMERTAESMVERAKTYVQRQLREQEDMLDLLQECKAKLDVRDYDGVAKLINAYCTLVKTGRTAYGLDEENTSKPQLAMVGQITIYNAPVHHQSEVEAEPIDVQTLETEPPPAAS